MSSIKGKKLMNFSWRFFFFFFDAEGGPRIPKCTLASIERQKLASLAEMSSEKKTN